MIELVFFSVVLAITVALFTVPVIAHLVYTRREERTIRRRLAERDTYPPAIPTARAWPDYDPAP